MVINALSDVWSDLHPAARNPARIIKANKDFSKRLEFKEIEFPVKVRDLHKIKKKIIVLALVILAMKERENT